ncbi:hypothetical protein FHE73_11500 [Bacillus thuringiensis]|nr:hypothetical protein CGQ22_07570 [Bacillus sp. M13(2017)]QCY61386.1 hypothetical protein FHE73_11500 [Bacillus thuringiensis]
MDFNIVCKKRCIYTRGGANTSKTKSLSNKKIAYKKCTRLYRNYVLRAHCILCLLYVKHDTSK